MGFQIHHHYWWWNNFSCKSVLPLISFLPQTPGRPKRGLIVTSPAPLPIVWFTPHIIQNFIFYWFSLQNIISFDGIMIFSPRIWQNPWYDHPDPGQTQIWRFSDVTDPPKTIKIPDFFTEMNLVTHKLSNALSLVVIRHLVVFILSGMSNCTLLSTPDLN